MCNYYNVSHLLPAKAFLMVYRRRSVEWLLFSSPPSPKKEPDRNTELENIKFLYESSRYKKLHTFVRICPICVVPTRRIKLYDRYISTRYKNCKYFIKKKFSTLLMEHIWQISVKMSIWILIKICLRNIQQFLKWLIFSCFFKIIHT